MHHSYLKRLVYLLLCCFLSNSSIADNKSDAIRDFWQPKYHAVRVNYCAPGGTECGLAVATQYCQLLGYPKALHAIEDHNVGATYYLGRPIRCHGWRCNGFKLIRCAKTLTNNPPKAYQYVFKHFPYPRFAHYRVDYCYTGKTGCGQRAAYSFCRRMGYHSVKHFVVDNHIAATKTLGNQQLCFGPQCRAFKVIDCKR